MDISSIEAFWRSWGADEGVESFSALHDWITERNANTPVDIRRIGLSSCAPWAYDEETGRISNAAGSFFQIAGLEKREVDLASGFERVVAQQPVLIQDEIGYLGIIAKEFDGVVHLLMQAKIEPGNINKVQVSPTIQATRSNFMQLHGGRRPAYLDYFIHSERHTVVVDQIQSEQSARFLGKRNRNVMLLVDEDVEVLPSHRWMTIGQLKRLMHYDNLVNMDTRTVLSCIPWSFWGISGSTAQNGDSTPFLCSIAAPFDMDEVNRVYTELNNAKMFDTSHTAIVPLASLADWQMDDEEVRHRRSYPFRVIFCDIAIEGREVKRWNQPLFEACGEAFFGLLACSFDGVEKYLVRCKPEIGCFDKVELAPTVQREAGAVEEEDDIDRLFMELAASGEGVCNDVMLSEEGGRFFCEQNRNVVVRLPECPSGLEPQRLPRGAFWLDFATLNLLVRANNVLNIQLRNLLSLLDVRTRC